ncbi:MAG: hypothetical protein ACQESD_01680 [Thermoplasmatota archaeon]
MREGRDSNRVIVYAVLLLLFLSLFLTAPCTKGEGEPSVSHDPPSEIDPDESKNITLIIDSDNISYVKINWWNIDDEGSSNFMGRQEGDDNSWAYEIPAQGENGNIHYWFNITMTSGDHYAYPSDYSSDTEIFRVTVVEKTSRDWTDWTYILPVGVVLVIAFIFLEWMKRKIPKNYDEEMEKKVEGKEDRKQERF